MTTYPNHSASPRRWALVSLLLACTLALGASGCGEDEMGTAQTPTIVSVTPECVASPDPDEFDGQVLDQVEVVVSDEEGDAAYVTIGIGGTVLRVDQGSEDGGNVVFTYVAPADDTSLLRCDPGTEIIVRAVDEAGNVAEMMITLL